MSYGIGTVFLPMVRRVLLATVALEIGYITYDCVLKPTAKSVNRILFPSIYISIMLIFSFSYQKSLKPKMRYKLRNLSYILIQSTHYSSFTQNNTNISNLITQFNTFKPLLNHYPITPKHTQLFREEKKNIKESMTGFMNKLDDLDLESLYQILINCLNISHKLIHYPFNQKLINVISNHILNAESLATVVNKELHERDILLTLFKSYSNSRLRLYEQFKVNFDGLYHLLNKHLSYYSIEQLIDLLIGLSNIYAKANLEGIKPLNQKIIYLLCDKIDKSNSRPSLYTLIQIVKSISKSDLTHLIKRISPYIHPTTNNLADTVSRDKINGLFNTEDKLRLEYKYLKLNIHLLAILLQINYLDIPLFNSIINSINVFLLKYYKDSSIHPLNTEKVINHYNIENKFVNKLLYPQCTNKLFKLPQLQVENDSNNGMESLDYILLSSVNKLMMKGKLAFVRGLKLCEMHFTTLYPTEYSQLNNNISYLKLLNYTNDKEYLITNNLLEKNRKLIESQLCTTKDLIIVRVGIYYIISPDPERKLHIELIRKGDKITKQLEFKRQYLHSNGWKPVYIRHN